MLQGFNKAPVEIVDITNQGLNSRLGRYYVGHTKELRFGNGYYAWGGIVNPYEAGVNLYFDIFTITNFSPEYFNAEIWLNAMPPVNAELSPSVVPSNQAIYPPPKPNAWFEQAEYLNENLYNGVNIFDRIIAPNSTLVSDAHNGSIIIGPGKTFSVLLKSSGPALISGIIVLTWWEEEISGGEED